MMATMEELDGHVLDTRGGLTMKMGNKRTALFFPLYHQLPLFALPTSVLCRIPIALPHFFQDVLPSYKNSIVLVA